MACEGRGGAPEGKEDEPDGGPAAGRGTFLFPREVSAWQLQRRLQRKVLRLENGLSSEVPFEEIEGEVQARRKANPNSVTPTMMVERTPFPCVVETRDGRV